MLVTEIKEVRQQVSDAVSQDLSRYYLTVCWDADTILRFVATNRFKIYVG